MSEIEEKAKVVADVARQLILVEGYDGLCMGEEFEPLISAIIDYDAAISKKEN